MNEAYISDIFTDAAEQKQMKKIKVKFIRTHAEHVLKILGTCLLVSFILALDARMQCSRKINQKASVQQVRQTQSI